MDVMIVCDILFQVAGLEEEWRGLDDSAARSSGPSEQEVAAREEIQTELARLFDMLPPDVRRTLQRLRSRGGRSTARLAGGACGACGNKLPTQLNSSAERGRRLVRCPSCSRYLVRLA